MIVPSVYNSRSDQCRPVFPDEVSAVAEQVLLGGPTQFEGPEVVQPHFGRTRLSGVSTKQVMHLKTHNNLIFSSSVFFKTHTNLTKHFG